MYPSKEAREIAILLRISRELDVVGDVTATVDSPSELLAWATSLTSPDIIAWRSQDPDLCYLQVAASHHRSPVRGRVTAVLPCAHHPEFWNALGLEHLDPGATKHLEFGDLSAAWSVMPITPADAETGEGSHGS